MNNPEQQFAAIGESSGALLGRQAAVHVGVWLVAFSMFAATDSWTLLTGWGLASFLNVLTGLLAGFLSVNLMHEWFHYFGARLASGHYTLARRPGIFVFDWLFDKNTLTQFYIMSIAGNLGGGLAVIALFGAVQADNPGRTALLAGATASFVLGAIIEWPVLLRSRKSRDPQAELAKLSPSALGRAAAGSAAAGGVCWMLLS